MRLSSGGDLAPSLGGQKIFFSHWPGFSDFPYLYCIKCRIWPFFTRKTTISEKNSLITPFFILFVLSRASDNTTSQYLLGGRMHGPSPASNLGGTVPRLKFGGYRLPSPPPRSPPLRLSICKVCVPGFKRYNDFQNLAICPRREDTASFEKLNFFRSSYF